MTHFTGQLISDARLNRSVAIPLLVISGLSTLPAILFAPPGVGLSVLALVILIYAAALSMRVTITADEEGLHARCMRIFTVNFAWAEILAVEKGPETGVLQGAGYRVLPGGKVGLLVGGPSVEVRDARRTYLLSVRDSQAVAEQLRRHLATAR